MTQLNNEPRYFYFQPYNKKQFQAIIEILNKYGYDNFNNVGYDKNLCFIIGGNCRLMIGLADVCDSYATRLQHNAPFKHINLRCYFNNEFDKTEKLFSKIIKHIHIEGNNEISEEMVTNFWYELRKEYYGHV